MPVSIEFLRGVLGIIALGCAYMAGRSLVAVRKGWQKRSRLYGWVIRTVACLVAVAFRHLSGAAPRNSPRRRPSRSVSAAPARGSSDPRQVPVANWSLTSLQQRLVKTGGRLIKHARYYWLLLAEGHLTRRLFGAMVRRGPEGTLALPVPAG